jgi:hypothetical protein
MEIKLISVKNKLHSNSKKAKFLKFEKVLSELERLEN